MTSVNRLPSIEAAQQLMAQGQPDAAAQVCRNLLDSDAQHGDAQHLLGIIYAQSGRLADAIALLEAATASLPADADLHSNLGHLFRQIGRLDKAGDCYRVAVSLRPDFPEALAGLGHVLRAQGRAQDAIEAFSAALALDDRHADLLFARATLLLEEGEYERSLADLDQAISLSPRAAEPRSSRATILAKWGYYEAAEAEHQRAVSLNPRFAEGYCSYAEFLLLVGRYSEALDQSRKALQLEPDFPEAHWNSSLAMLHLGRYHEAWPEYEWRWQCSSFRKMHPQDWPLPRPDRKATLHGKRLLVFAEQGYGDVIQFLRYLPLLKAEGAVVTFLAYERLVGLLTDERFTGIEVVSELKVDRPFDYALPLMSLPGRYATTAENIPCSDEAYLKPNFETVDIFKWLPNKSQRRRIGLMWRGGEHATLHPRSIPLAMLAELVSDRFEWVGLPLEAGAEEEHLLKWFPEMVCPLAEQKNFLDTAAIIATCDLVISVDTSIAHLAGAMGVPAWVMLPLWSDWRWSVDSEKSRWYPSVRLFRQKKAGEWGDVIESVKSCLSSELSPADGN